MQLTRDLTVQLGSLMVLFTILVVVLKNSSVYPILFNTLIDTYQYPRKPDFHVSLTRSLIGDVSEERLGHRLEELSQLFPDSRYYNSESGYRSALYFYDVLQGFTQRDRGRYTVRRFKHNGWRQPTLIFRIQGIHEQIVILGCHLDSMNLNPFANAPGVDDNLSGIDVVLEALDIFTNESIVSDLPVLQNTLEFHFYAAEEVGSLGSQEVFKEYRKNNRKVIAMLQQDMTGYTEGSNKKGIGEHFGIITDYASVTLTEFVKSLVDQYSEIPYLETRCRKVCSDHVSSLMYGYPGAYALESVVDMSNPYIHSDQDTLEWINIGHVRKHAELVVAYISELAFTEDLPLASSVKDYMSFGYYDFIIMFSMTDTFRFVWCVALLATCVALGGSIYDDVRGGEGVDQAYEVIAHHE
ncbi:hypothetical protein FOA43_003765 [Brettanomyces nanus]|uniref:Peptide hydrolase n=1 Tax=Eeniella nana TaxID=13502 RepID=A0A875RWL6_EENNA|nr:uncharacterized protein FOA43_003765 [Brettanomyces nanus]QPG76377.1 hypothetical protein FOA43_003765 [Brettanomyces nanus]